MTPEPPISLWPDSESLGTITDLYELTMMAGYHASGMAGEPATFEIFVRRMPPNRSYLVFAGLEQAVGDLMRLAFSAEQIEAIRAWPAFRERPASFFEMLRELRFKGDVWAAPEGTVVFPGETLVRVSAPLLQAQWVETFLLASLGYPTLVASKAARMVVAAEGRSLFEFGARRAHGPQAGLLAARAAYLAGFEATSHVEAARRLNIPCVGTMAHSWVQSFDTESEAFAAYARAFPTSTTLLVDTYDTLEGVRNAATLDAPVAAVRIDSGDLAILSRQARAILDAHGRRDVKILGSGDVDENQLAALVAAGAPIDGYGIGTELVTSRDGPALSMVYKLVELEGRGRYKLAPGKKTYPMAKQVYRRRDAAGRFVGDLVARADEPPPADGEALLVPVLRQGRLVDPPPSLEAIRERCKAQITALPEALRKLDSDVAYPVAYSDALEADAARIMDR
ncbi:nicotinate phosphoribosyltransferase [Paludisphaera borealis]|uniref:Nicotinate phosphoribosyltransferase n=1 Tax=Paludisphaera borealis TaxID=1387353 RepID=A0A1U7CPY7_9BACT|nr:nicotinate phosphoribosyltransferase [Paludisphaera borealis]APW61004.1 Nicotinate phosphoribosyltransferase pncB2 [Paludisphaera borealis]